MKKFNNNKRLWETILKFNCLKLVIVKYISAINAKTKIPKNMTDKNKKYTQELLSKGPKYVDMKSDIIIYSFN